MVGYTMDVWMGEESPTGKLRWWYPSKSDKPYLQQEWKIVAIDLTVTYEWRMVPGVVE